jgi:hypothetical protein
MSEAQRAYPAAVTGIPADDPFAAGLAANWALSRRNANQPVLVYGHSTTELLAVPDLQELLSRPRVTPVTWGAPIEIPSSVLAVAPSATHLSAIAANPRTAALCVMPADLDDVAAWAVGTAAARLGSAANVLPGGDGRLTGDPILLHAMQTLDRQVKHTTQLAAGPDRDATTGMLTLLYDSGHWAAPDDLLAWALRVGWPIKSARRLRTIAAVIASGSRVEPKDGSAGHQLLTTWRERDPLHDPAAESLEVPSQDGAAGTA